MSSPRSGPTPIFPPFDSGSRYNGPTRPDQFEFISDLADRKLAALAAAAGAVLLTNDRHLLSSSPHPGVVVLTPGEFVHLNRPGSSDPL